MVRRDEKYGSSSGSLEKKPNETEVTVRFAPLSRMLNVRKFSEGAEGCSNETSPPFFCCRALAKNIAVHQNSILYERLASLLQPRYRVVCVRLVWWSTCCAERLSSHQHRADNTIVAAFKENNQNNVPKVVVISLFLLDPSGTSRVEGIADLPPKVVGWPPLLFVTNRSQ